MLPSCCHQRTGRQCWQGEGLKSPLSVRTRSEAGVTEENADGKEEGEDGRRHSQKVKPWLRAAESAGHKKELQLIQSIVKLTEMVRP